MGKAQLMKVRKKGRKALSLEIKKGGGQPITRKE